MQRRDGLFVPPDVKMKELHLAVWWGALLMAIGTVYTVRFRTGRG